MLAITSDRFTTGVTVRSSVLRMGIILSALRGGRSTRCASTRRLQGPGDAFNHLGHLSLGQLRVDRDGQSLSGSGVGLREGTARARNPGEAFLARQRERVVDLAADAVASKMLQHAVPNDGSFREADDVLVEDMAAAWKLAGEDDPIAQPRFAEEHSIARRVLPSSLGPLFQMAQLDVEDGRLQRIDAEVAADVAVKILRTHSVNAEVE